MSKKSESTFKEKRKLRLQELYKDAHAITIQTVWRGYSIRKRLRSLVKETFSRRLQLIPSETCIDSKFLRSEYKSLQEYSIKIDLGLGFPFNSSISRISLRVLNSKRSQLGTVFSSFADLESDMRFPFYNSSFSWKLSDLTITPDCTLVIRIDTLERPSLKCKCMGYSALKLFINIKGEQAATSEFDCCYLNSGIHLLPVSLGYAPIDVGLSESVINNLPRLPDAWICVRLHDSADLRPDLAFPMTLNRLTSLYTRHLRSPLGPSCGTIASSILHGLPFCHSSLPEIAFDSDMKLYARGQSNFPGKARVLSSLFNWQLSAILPPSEIQQLLMSTFILPYQNHGENIMASLDELYNMPHRSITSISTHRPVVAKFKTYKVSMQIIGGSGGNDVHQSNESKLSNVSQQQKQTKSQNGEAKRANRSIDCSRQMHLHSTQRFPTFQDGLQVCPAETISSTSCLLLTIRAVDVFVLKTEYGDNSPIKLDVDQDLKIHIYSSGTSTTFWGLLPLTVSSPFHRHEDDQIVYSTDLPSHLANFDHDEGIIKRNKNINQKDSKIDSKIPFADKSQESSSLPTTNATNIASKKDAMDPAISNSESSWFFIQDGSHMIPLFHGLPPASIVKSEDPWKQLSSEMTVEVANSRCNWCQGRSSVSVMPLQSPFRLAEGASAIVRISTPLLQSLLPRPIYEYPSCPLKKTTVQALVQQSLPPTVPNNSSSLRKAMRIYEYNSLLSQNSRLIASTLPSGIPLPSILQKLNSIYSSMMEGDLYL